MIRAAVLAVLIGCGPAIAQVAPTAPVKPTIAKPSTAKPPVAPLVKPAVSAKLLALQSELKSLDTKIAALKVGGAKDSISELNREDMAQLEAMIKRKNELEQMISDAMKSGSEGGEAGVTALKDS